MSLRTGKRLHGFIWNEVPVTEEVIDRVEQLGEEDGQPLMENGPIFEWAPGLIVEDAEEQPPNVPPPPQPQLDQGINANVNENAADEIEGDEDAWEEEFEEERNMQNEDGAIITDEGNSSEESDSTRKRRFKK